MGSVLRNATNDVALARDVECARGAVERAVGLLGRARVSPDQGLWIERCSAVHTLGMRATLDLYFLDREGRVVRIVSAVRPNRVAVVCLGAASVVELGASEAPRAVALGDRLIFDAAEG